MLNDTLPPTLFDPVDEDAPRVRATDPVTSHQAADATRKSRAGSRDAVLAALLRDGALADHELVLAVQSDATWNGGRMYSPSRIRTARSELVERGLVEDAGFTRKTVSGLDAIVWRAVDDEEAPF